MILSLDPGITTGYACLTDQGVLLETGNLLLPELQGKISYWQRTASAVVVERIPIPTGGMMNTHLLEIVSIVKASFPEATYVKPGVWKQSPQIVNIKFPKEFSSPSEHQKDAYRLGMYYIIFVQSRLDK